VDPMNAPPTPPGQWTLWQSEPDILVEKAVMAVTPPPKGRAALLRDVAIEHGLWAAILGVYVLAALAPAIARVTIVDRSLFDLASIGYFLHVL
jgi:hypothetical protein